ncbi:MAG: tetratricopeptide repeat protein [Candidatus Sumerlaeaceae bacterium]
MPRAKSRRIRKTATVAATRETAMDWKQRWLPPFGLILLTFLAYYPVIAHGGFIWDDDDYVTENLTLRSLGGLWQIWAKPGATHQYYPFVHTSFWIEYHLWGLWAAGFHAVNVVLHSVNALLVWRLLSRLAIPGALLAAFIFALHPVHAESVAWITERKNVLSGFFYLLSIGAFLKAVPDIAALPDRMAEGRRFRSWYGIAILCFVAALLSKTVTCTLPAVVLLIAWWKHGRIFARHVRLTAPFFVIGFALALVTIWLERNHVGAHGKEWAFTFPERILIAGRALWFYPGKLIWPASLMFFYPKWQLDSGSLLQWLFPLGFVALLIGLVLLARRIGRGSATAVLFAAGTLFPALGFFNVYPMRYSFVADHFQYLASLGWIVLFAALVVGTNQAKPLIKPRWVRLVGGAILACVLGALTWQRAHVLSSAELLWRDTLAKNPAADIAHDNLGNLLTAEGKFEEGLKHYRAAIAHDPDDDFAHYNAGVNLYRQGRLPEAIQHYHEAIRIEPRYFEAHYNLGKALERLGQRDSARGYYKRALETNPRFVPARIALAVLLVNDGQREQAVDEYNRVLKLDPNHATARYNLGAVLLDLGRKREAAEQFSESLRLNPADNEARQMLEELTTRK